MHGNDNYNNRVQLMVILTFNISEILHMCVFIYTAAESWHIQNCMYLKDTKF